MAEAKRKEYIDLIRSFRDREGIRRARSGINFKVLVAAAVALLWSVAPHLGVLVQKGVMFDQVAALAGTLIALGILGCFLVADGVKPKGTGSGSRIYQWEAYSGFGRIAVFLGLVFGLPIYLIGFLDAEYVGALLAGGTKWITTGVLGLMLLGLFVVLFLERRSFAKYDMPSLVFQARLEKRQSRKFGRVVWRAILLVAVLLNLSVSLLLSSVLLHAGHEYFLVSLNMSFLFFVLLAVPSQLKHGERDKRLEKIELEAVLGDIEDDRLSTVIEDELMGVEFGEWMARRLSYLRELQGVVREKSGELPELIAQLNDIDKEYVDERISRFERFHDVYSAAFDAYLDESKKLANWMDAPWTMSAARSDPRLADALKSSFEEFRADFSEVSDLREKNSKLIKVLLADIRGDSNDN